MSLKTTTLRANFINQRSTAHVRSRIGNARRPYSPQSSANGNVLGAGPGAGGIGTGGTVGSSGGVGLGTAGAAGAAGKKAAPSKHIVWYREIVPAMMPVIGIGTAIFFALQLIQTHLSHSRSLHDAQIRITHLESELAHLQTIQRKQAASWGDSLGRVIKHVQKAAVGPTNPNAESNSTSTPALSSGMVSTSTSTSTPSTTDTITPLTGTSKPLVEQLDQAKRSAKEGLGKVEAGMESLVDRVKDEFGVVVQDENKKKGKGWRGWVGL